ncbi:protein FAR1-RELATED SEQUENCE 5-like [Spinacia oleracea]|uniref:Protein FAR1-RELATED SEQUENCE 5-like n=1 Tax=Spinacia oleracea TaxID=3562 RepID=A0ABM3RJ30_SPIOL|nr:protein FAR1-RELATED SEQUENCE 5-like [Spinacia oleracea]
MNEIQQEEDEYEPNHDQLQFENEERVERQGGENETPNKCRSPMSVIKEWVPVCEDDLKPKEGMEFDNLEEYEKFYKKYAHQVGFSVRKSSSKKDKKTGLLKYKTCVCAKEGFREAKYAGKQKVRNVKLSREGCEALVGFKRTPEGKYVVYKFHEGHTHLIATPRKCHMLKSNRGITNVHRCLYKAFSRANVGASRAHRYIKEQVGGYQNVGCSKQDLKNFQRDLSLHIKDYDVDMFIENFKSKQTIDPSFYFAYEINKATRQLRHVFWADCISRKNYALYGDVLSFDTTYGTNRYKMIFAPFTGLDNHRLCITFGASFLGDEKAESFSWLFEKFLDAMEGHKPVCIITDQDPAYFRDVFLGVVLRTTSRSESENSFYCSFTNPHLSLVEFWMRFESVVESQRHSQSMSDNDNFSLIPELKTNRDLERHASQVYTFTNFYKFQEQLWLACMDCEVEDKKETEEGLVITISNHARKNGKMREMDQDGSKQVNF